MKLRIRNFQSHRDTKIILSKGITSFEGISRQGKSSILRAVKWVIKNTSPKGVFMRRKAKNSTSVLFDVIKRLKTSKSNEYHTSSDKFKAIRKDVPEEVEKLLNIHEGSLQAQHDPFFLIDPKMSAGKVAKEIAKLADLEIVAKVLTVANSRVKKSTNSITRMENNIEEIDEGLSELKDVDKMEDDFERLHKLNSGIEKAKVRLATLNEAIRVYNAEKEYLDSMPDESILPKLKTLLKKHDEIEADRKELAILNNHIEKVLKYTDMAELTPEPLIIMCKEIGEELKKLHELDHHIEQIKLNKGQYRHAIKKHNELQLRYDAVLKEHGMCPTCKREI
jgi:DNA repair protein SbcC/Rad50